MSTLTHEVSTPQQMKEFWQMFEGLTLVNIQKDWDNGSKLTKHFIEVAHSFIGQDEYVTTIIRCFSSDRYDVNQAMKNIILVRKRLDVNDRDLRVKTHDIQGYLKCFTVDADPSTVKVDEENIFTFTSEEIAEARKYLESTDQIVCTRTLKSYLIEKRTKPKAKAKFRDQFRG